MTDSSASPEAAESTVSISDKGVEDMGYETLTLSTARLQNKKRAYIAALGYEWVGRSEKRLKALRWDAD